MSSVDWRCSTKQSPVAEVARASCRVLESFHLQSRLSLFVVIHHILILSSKKNDLSWLNQTKAVAREFWDAIQALQEYNPTGQPPVTMGAFPGSLWNPRGGREIGWSLFQTEY
jgi:hypothetical protein